MRDQVAGVREHRLEAARELVLALGAGVEAREALADAEVDALVVAGLEMQLRVVLGAAPVAAVERVGADDVERAGNDLAPVLGDDQQQAVGHRLPQQPEELAVQVAAVAAAAGVGQLVEVMEALPQRRVDLGPAQRAHLQPLFHHQPPLAPELLALARLHRVEEIGEVAIAAVVPVELHAGAVAETRCGQFLGDRLLGKQQVPRRGAETRHFLAAPSRAVRPSGPRTPAPRPAAAAAPPPA